MVDCRMLQGPLAGNIVSVAAEDAAAGLNDGWAAPVALFTSYPWPWDVDRSLITEPNPPTYDEWVEAGSPPGAPHGPPQPLTPPTLTSISPTSAQLGTLPYSLALTGTNFTPMSKAFVQKEGMPDSELVTHFMNATTLSADMGGEPAAAGDVGIVVKQGENVTAPQTFTFEAAEPPPEVAANFTGITLANPAVMTLDSALSYGFFANGQTVALSDSASVVDGTSHVLANGNPTAFTYELAGYDLSAEVDPISGGIATLVQ